MFKKIAKDFKKGFTLIELLVVIAVMGVLAAAVLVAINPADKIRAANDSKAQADVGQIVGAINSYATSNGGYYPPNLAALTTAKELTVVPVAATGYTYTYTATPVSCTTLCNTAKISSNLLSAKYTATPFWNWCNTSGSAAAVALAATCP